MLRLSQLLDATFLPELVDSTSDKPRLSAYAHCIWRAFENMPSPSLLDEFAIDYRDYLQSPLQVNASLHFVYSSCQATDS